MIKSRLKRLEERAKLQGQANGAIYLVFDYDGIITINNSGNQLFKGTASEGEKILETIDNQKNFIVRVRCVEDTVR